MLIIGGIVLLTGASCLSRVASLLAPSLTDGRGNMSTHISIFPCSMSGTEELYNGLRGREEEGGGRVCRGTRKRGRGWW